VSLPGMETFGSAAGSQGCTAVTFQMQADLLLMSLLWYYNVTYALQTHLYSLKDKLIIIIIIITISFKVIFLSTNYKLVLYEDCHLV
jgi:hypothetical protein